MTKRFKFSLWILFLLILPLRSALAETHHIIITVLGASNEGSNFNLDNDVYRDKLIKLFSYTSYNQITQQKVSLQKSEKQALTLPQGYELLLFLKAEEQGRILVQATILKEKQKFLDTSLSMLKPGVVFLGGPPFEKGDLFLVLEAVQ